MTRGGMIRKGSKYRCKSCGFVLAEALIEIGKDHWVNYNSDVSTAWDRGALCICPECFTRYGWSPGILSDADGWQ